MYKRKREGKTNKAERLAQRKAQPYGDFVYLRQLTKVWTKC